MPEVGKGADHSGQKEWPKVRGGGKALGPHGTQQTMLHLEAGGVLS